MTDREQLRELISEFKNFASTLKKQLTSRLTHDDLVTQHVAERRFATFDSSPEAVDFANACNAVGRALRSRADCRPILRQTADAKRETAADAAEDFATQARAFHRK